MADKLSKENDEDLLEDSYGDESGEENEEDVERTELGALPYWANEEVTTLHKQLLDLEEKKEKIDAELEENKESMATISAHFTNVQEEVRNTQALNNIKQKQIDTETHFKALADRIIGKGKQELIQIKEKRAVLEDNLNTTKNDQFATRERQEKLMLEKDWNEDALKEWEAAVKQKEDDTRALDAYTRADDKKVKALTLTQEKLTQQLKETERQLEAEITETRAKQIELDKTVDQYRALHRERQTLVQQWQDTLDTMGRRDEEIENAGIQYGKAMRELDEQQQALKEQADRLEMQSKDNKDLESRIAMKERFLTKKREQLLEVKRVVEELNDQTTIIKTELQRAAETLEQGRIGNQNQSQLLEQKRERLDQAREQLQKVKMDLEKSNLDNDNVEALAKRHETVLKTNKEDLKKQQKSIEALKDVQFKRNQELFRLRKEENDLIAEIEGARAAGKNLRDKIRKLDQQSLKQQELVYNAEFQIQQLERKVARASGQRTDEEKKVLNAKIDELRNELAAVGDQNKMLKDQRKKLDNEVRRNKRTTEQMRAQHAKLSSDIAEITLRNSTAEKDLHVHKKERETKMVEHDTLKLELNKRKTILSGKADEVSGLENRKYQLQKSMQERREEINVVMQKKQARLKLEEEAKHESMMDLNKCYQQLAGLRAKYESVRMYLSEGGEQKSQAYFIIKAAQRKEELKRVGDSLDSQVRKSAKELRALKKTLKHMLKKNTNFRKGFANADEKSDIARKVSQLQAQGKQAADTLFAKKKQLHRLNRDSEDLQSRMETMSEQHRQAVRRKQSLSSALQIVEKELKEAQDKLERSSNKVAKQSRQHRSGGMDLTEATLEEKRMRAQAIRENNQNVLFTLTELANEFPEIESSLSMVLTKEKLRLPDRPPSAASSNIDV